MAKNHGVTKRNRRPVSGKRRDTKRIAKTMATLKQLAIAESQREMAEFHENAIRTAKL